MILDISSLDSCLKYKQHLLDEYSAALYQINYFNDTNHLFKNRIKTKELEDAYRKLIRNKRFLKELTQIIKDYKNGKRVRG